MPSPILEYQLPVTSVATSPNPGSVYTGTITGGANNAYANCYALVTGCSVVPNGSNNGTYLVLSSNATALVLANEFTVNATVSALVTIFASVPAGVGPDSVSPALTTGNTGGSPPFANPPATGTLITEGAPDGASLTPRNFQAGWNFVNSQTSTGRITAALVSAKNDGVAFNFQTPVTPGTAPLGASVGLKTDVQTTPSAPTGSFVQQGAAAISNVSAVTLAGYTPGQCSFVQWNGAFAAK